MEFLIPVLVSEGSNQGALIRFAFKSAFFGRSDQVGYNDNEPVNFSSSTETGWVEYRKGCDRNGADRPTGRRQLKAARLNRSQFNQYSDGTSRFHAQSFAPVWERREWSHLVRFGQVVSGNQLEKNASNDLSGTNDAQDRDAMSDDSSEMGARTRLTQIISRHALRNERLQRNPMGGEDRSNKSTITVMNNFGVSNL